MKYLLAFVALVSIVFPVQGQQSPVKPAPSVTPWFSGDSAKPTFQGDNWSSWWNSQSKFSPVWHVPSDSRLLTAEPANAVCAIPLREVPVAQDIDPQMVHAPSPIIDRMPEVNVPPSCDDRGSAILKPR